MSETRLNELLKACKLIASLRLCPATSGNYSIRHDQQSMLISASGKDKRQLKEADFVLCDYEAKYLSGEGQPSAEGALHGMIYQLSPDTQCILHTHSVAVTVLSLQYPDHPFEFHGYEMQKVIAGITTHEANLKIYSFDNDQDMQRLARCVQEMWPQLQMSFGFVVKGHGLYAWGNSVAQALRHMEGLEFLFCCELAKRQLEKK